MRKVKNINIKEWEDNNFLDDSFIDTIINCYPIRNNPVYTQKEDNSLELNCLIPNPIVYNNKNNIELLLKNYNVISADYNNFNNIYNDYLKVEEENKEIEDNKNIILEKIDVFYNYSNNLINIKNNLNDIINELSIIKTYFISESEYDTITEKIRNTKIDDILFNDNIPYLKNIIDLSTNAMLFLESRNYKDYDIYKQRWRNIKENIFEDFKSYLYYYLQNDCILTNNLLNRITKNITNFKNNIFLYENNITNNLQYENVTYLLKYLITKKQDDSIVSKIINFLFMWYSCNNFDISKKIINDYLSANNDDKINNISDMFYIFIYNYLLLYYNLNIFNEIFEIKFVKEIDNFLKNVYYDKLKYLIISKINQNDINDFITKFDLFKDYKNNFLFIYKAIEANNSMLTIDINNNIMRNIDNIINDIISTLERKLETIINNIFKQEYLKINVNNSKLYNENEIKLENLEDYDFRLFKLSEYLYNIFKKYFMGNKLTQFTLFLSSYYLLNILNSKKYFKNEINFNIFSYYYIDKYLKLMNITVDYDKYNKEDTFSINIANIITELQNFDEYKINIIIIKLFTYFKNKVENIEPL